MDWARKEAEKMLANGAGLEDELTSRAREIASKILAAGLDGSLVKVKKKAATAKVKDLTKRLKWRETLVDLQAEAVVEANKEMETARAWRRKFRADESKARDSMNKALYYELKREPASAYARAFTISKESLIYTSSERSGANYYIKSAVFAGMTARANALFYKDNELSCRSYTHKYLAGRLHHWQAIIEDSKKDKGDAHDGHTTDDGSESSPGGRGNKSLFLWRDLCSEVEVAKAARDLNDPAFVTCWQSAFGGRYYALLTAEQAAQTSTTIVRKTNEELAFEAFVELSELATKGHSSAEDQIILFKMYFAGPAALTKEELSNDIFDKRHHSHKRFISNPESFPADQVLGNNSIFRKQFHLNFFIFYLIGTPIFIFISISLCIRSACCATCWTGRNR